MREKIEVYVERCRDDVILPTYANKICWHGYL